jgi:hypothetical protein
MLETWITEQWHSSQRDQAFVAVGRMEEVPIGHAAAPLCAWGRAMTRMRRGNMLHATKVA